MDQIVHTARSAKAPWVFRRLTISYHTVAALIGAVDGILIIASSVFADWFYNVLLRGESGQIDIALGIGFAGALSYILLAKALGLYNLQVTLNPYRSVSKILFAWATVLLSLTAVLFLLRVGTIFSRGTIIIFALTEIGVLIGSRPLSARISRSVIARGSIVGRRAVIIGELTELGQLSARSLLVQFGLKELARVAIAEDSDASSSAFDSTAVDLAINLARQEHADELVIAIDWRRAELLEKIKDRLRTSPLAVQLLPDRFVRSMVDGQSPSVSKTPLLVELQRAPLTPIERLVKRAFDIVMAAIALVVSLPFMILIATAIKLDSAGPILFRQQRTGFDGEKFFIYKFRTMTV